MRDLLQLKQLYQDRVNEYTSDIDVVEYKNSKNIIIKCKKCGYIRTVTNVALFYNKRACPVCCNQKVIIGINSLWDTHPHIAKLLKNKDDGYTISFGSGKKFEWVCPSCGFVTKPLSVYQIVKHGISCKQCSDGNSLPNKFMFNLLTILLDDKFEYEIVFDWCKFKIKNLCKTGRYDFCFAINQKKYLIEMDGGIGHGHNTIYNYYVNDIDFATPEITKEIDNIKDKLALEHGYQIIRIDCSQGCFSDIVNNTKHSLLGELFDLENVDYTYLFEKCLKSRVIEASDLWNNGIKSTYKIAKIMKVTPATVITYLKHATSIHKCDYSPDISYKLATQNHSQVCREKLGTSVICLTTGEVFNSYAEAKEKYNCNPYICCRNHKPALYSGVHPETKQKLQWMKYDNYTLNYLR